MRGFSFSVFILYVFGRFIFSMNFRFRYGRVVVFIFFGSYNYIVMFLKKINNVKYY